MNPHSFFTESFNFSQYKSQGINNRPLHYVRHRHNKLLSLYLSLRNLIGIVSSKLLSVSMHDSLWNTNR